MPRGDTLDEADVSLVWLESSPDRRRTSESPHAEERKTCDEDRWLMDDGGDD
jgi:hypothetical protein